MQAAKKTSLRQNVIAVGTATFYVHFAKSASSWLCFVRGCFFRFMPRRENISEILWLKLKIWRLKTRRQKTSNNWQWVFCTAKVMMWESAWKINFNCSDFIGRGLNLLKMSLVFIDLNARLWEKTGVCCRRSWGLTVDCLSWSFDSRLQLAEFHLLGRLMEDRK